MHGEPGRMKRSEGTNARLSRSAEEVRHLGLVGRFFETDNILFTHSSYDSHHELLSIIESFLYFFAEGVTEELDILLSGTVRQEHVEETVVDIHKRVFVTGDVRHIHVVGGRGYIFELLTGEDIDGDEVNFCVTVLARLGCGHINNFAGPALDHDVSVLPESRALRRVGERGPRTGILEGLVVLLVLVVGHAGRRVFSTTTAGLL